MTTNDDSNDVNNNTHLWITNNNVRLF